MFYRSIAAGRPVLFIGFVVGVGDGDGEMAGGVGGGAGRVVVSDCGAVDRQSPLGTSKKTSEVRHSGPSTGSG